MHARTRRNIHMCALALIWHAKTHVVTACGMPGNSSKGMLIFQMLLDINKPPNWRAEIQFERSSPWRYRDVYPSLSISLAEWLRGHLVFTYDKGFLFDYQLSCSQQRGHSGEHSFHENLIVACLGDLSWPGSSTLHTGPIGRMIISETKFMKPLQCSTMIAHLPRANKMPSWASKSSKSQVQTGKW